MTPTSPSSGSSALADSTAPPEESFAPRPVGQGDYLVGQGECVSSIAKEKGYFWETIWNHGPNSELKTVRKDPNVLFPGDRVTLPTKKEKQDAGATEMRHRFVRRGQPAFLRLRLMDHDDKPRAGCAYMLEIDGEQFPGTTDGDGRLECPIRGNAQRGKLTLETPEGARVFTMKLGALDPIEEITGVQGRLNNLRFNCGAVDGVVGPKTRAALRSFQGHNNLKVTGAPDEPTRQKLVERHGS